VSTAAPQGSGPAASSVQSVDRALDLLEALAEAEGPRGVGELAQLTGLPQGTVHRLLRSLQGRGYVRHAADRKYALGTAAFRLGDAAQRVLARTARPYLTSLVQRTGETANLSVLEDDDVVYVAQVPSPHTLRMFAEVGRHVPPHSTASGKVMLAALPDDRLTALLRRLPLTRLTEHTITDRAVLVAELARVREQGWATDDGEQERGVRCVAVPVGHDAQVLAALSLSGPAERFDPASDHGLVQDMVRLAERFAEELSGGYPA
jgi:IclR family acetate operon transcriptional repressor